MSPRPLAAVTILMIPYANVYIEITFVLLVLLALSRAIVSPAGGTARKSIIPDVAGPAGLSLERANSIHEAVFATGFAIGPAVGALFIGFIGPYDVFIVVAIFSALSAVAMFLVRTQKPGEMGSQKPEACFRTPCLEQRPSLRPRRYCLVLVL
jgi:MFS transporter, DHA3 family, macrolide efflux protein